MSTRRLYRFAPTIRDCQTNLTTTHLLARCPIGQPVRNRYWHYLAPRLCRWRWRRAAPMAPSVPARRLALPLNGSSRRPYPPRKLGLRRPVSRIRWADQFATRARRVAGSIPSVGEPRRPPPLSDLSASRRHSKASADCPEIRQACAGPCPSFRGSTPVGQKTRPRRPQGRNWWPARQTRQPARNRGSRSRPLSLRRSLAPRPGHPIQASRAADPRSPMGSKTTATIGPRRPAATPDGHRRVPTWHSLSTILRRPRWMPLGPLAPPSPCRLPAALRSTRRPRSDPFGLRTSQPPTRRRCVPIPPHHRSTTRDRRSADRSAGCLVARRHHLCRPSPAGVWPTLSTRGRRRRQARRTLRYLRPRASFRRQREWCSPMDHRSSRPPHQPWRSSPAAPPVPTPGPPSVSPPTRRRSRGDHSHLRQSAPRSHPSSVKNPPYPAMHRLAPPHLTLPGSMNCQVPCRKMPTHAAAGARRSTGRSPTAPSQMRPDSRRSTMLFRARPIRRQEAEPRSTARHAAVSTATQPRQPNEARSARRFRRIGRSAAAGRDSRSAIPDGSPRDCRRACCYSADAPTRQLAPSAPPRERSASLGRYHHHRPVRCCDDLDCSRCCRSSAGAG